MAALLSSKVKMGVAAGAGAILLVLALLGGVVGWIHSGEDTTPPQVEYPLIFPLSSGNSSIPKGRTVLVPLM